MQICQAVYNHASYILYPSTQVKASCVWTGYDQTQNALLQYSLSTNHGVCQRHIHVGTSHTTLRSLISSVHVAAMLNQLKWPTLQECRAQTKEMMIHGINNALIDIPNTSKKILPVVPFAQTLIYQRSFFSDTIRFWNSFPQNTSIVSY